jgi:hypothetical protein
MQFQRRRLLEIDQELHVAAMFVNESEQNVQSSMSAQFATKHGHHGQFLFLIG